MAQEPDRPILLSDIVALTKEVSDLRRAVEASTRKNSTRFRWVAAFIVIQAFALGMSWFALQETQRVTHERACDIRDAVVLLIQRAGERSDDPEALAAFISRVSDDLTPPGGC